MKIRRGGDVDKWMAWLQAWPRKEEKMDTELQTATVEDIEINNCLINTVTKKLKYIWTVKICFIGLSGVVTLQLYIHNEVDFSVIAWKKAFFPHIV